MKLHGHIEKDFGRRTALVRPYKTYLTWVLVIDQHIARVFEKHETALDQIGTALPDLNDTFELSNRTMGRNATSASGSIHHKYDVHMNESRQQHIAFVHQLAEWLDEAERAEAFDRLVLVAPPKTLGLLRQRLHDAVYKRVIAEVDKDLTKTPLERLEKELADIDWY